MNDRDILKQIATSLWGDHKNMMSRRELEIAEILVRNGVAIWLNDSLGYNVEFFYDEETTT